MTAEGVEPDIVETYRTIAENAVPSGHEVERHGHTITVNWDRRTVGGPADGAHKARVIQAVLDSRAPLVIDDTHDGAQGLTFVVPEGARE